jgi:broad specificity phosphatase PhoE
MLIYCIRHGESCYNAEGRLQGQSHTPLSPLGLRQADAVAAALADKPIEAIYTSPLPRAAQTAAAVAGPHKLTPVADPRLMEINVGVFQDLLHAEIADRYPAETALWRGSDPDYRIPGGESRRDLMVRGRAAFDAIAAGGQKTVAVVSHGGLLAAIFKSILGVSAERNPFSLYNTSVSQIVIGREFKLLTLNNVDHLGPAGYETIHTRADFF